MRKTSFLCLARCLPRRCRAAHGVPVLRWKSKIPTENTMSNDNLITSFAVQYQLERNHRPFRRESIRQLQENRCGVYALWIPGDIEDAYTCLYVGISTTSVRRRLLEHLSYEENPQLRQQLRMFEDIVTFTVAFTKNDVETQLLETAVIQKWQPLTNRNKLG